MSKILLCSREDIKCELYSIYTEMKAEAEKKAEAKAQEVLLTPEEVQDTLKISSTTLWRWAKGGYLTPIFIGGKKRFKRSDVMTLIEKGGNTDER